MRALVVDDDEEVLVFAAEALSSFSPGFDVATARDLEAAVLWLDVFAPDILLLNPELCGGNVQKIAERLRGDQRTRNCKIVTVSNGLDTAGYKTGTIYIVTGVILLLAVTLDTIARRLQAKSGR